MSETETVTATSGNRSAAFTLNWNERRLTSASAFEMADFPFVAEVAGKRFELYGDGTFDEEELSPGERAAERA